MVVSASLSLPKHIYDYREFGNISSKGKESEYNMCHIGMGERILGGLFHYEMVSKKNGRMTFNSH